MALPFWATEGFDKGRGGFHERIGPNGPDYPAPRRARVQARQIWVYAEAARLGIGAPRLDMARAAYGSFLKDYRGEGGLFVTATGADRTPSDPTTRLYEQAFALLAMAAVHAADPGGTTADDDARQLRKAIEGFRHSERGFAEVGVHRYQSNAHMHLLEAALAWAEAGADGWDVLADEIVSLALAKFIDPNGHFLREYFDAAWQPAPGDDGSWIEPGHQFEWAWLLTRWAARRGDAALGDVAQDLFAIGRIGVDLARKAAVNVLWDDLSIRDATARLWPQTEYLKAALALGHDADVLVAAEGLSAYLDWPKAGAWRDIRRVDGSFVDEPAPASSFYHVAGACFALIASQATSERR